MELDWIIKEPIDYEYKQYLLLDYFQKVEKDFEDFKLYPRFREISLHLANIKSIISDRNYILLKKRTKDIDEEIVMGDLIFEKIDTFTQDEQNDIVKVAKFSDDILTKYFMHGKVLWDLMYQSIDLNMIQYKSGIREKYGFFVIDYFELKFIYQYEIVALRKTGTETKLKVKEIYCGTTLDIHQAIAENVVFTHKGFESKFNSVKLPIFEFGVTQRFDFTHSVIPLIKRKILSYIKQSNKSIEFNF